MNIHLNSMKLHALIDGLALHKLLNPNGVSNDDIQIIVDEEIVRLTHKGGRPVNFIAWLIIFVK